jgi:hypothetical protein
LTRVNRKEAISPIPDRGDQWESTNGAGSAGRATGLGQVPTEIRKKPLADKPQEKILQLKNGAQVEATIGVVYFEELSDLLDQEPEHFRTLLALARGQSEGIPAEHTKALQRDGFLKGGGVLDEDMRNVLLSAYQETAEGVVLVNPFLLATPVQAAELERLEERGLDRLIRKLRKQKGDDKDRPPERS